MTSLPISSHKTQPAGNAASTLSADGLAVDMQSAEPFAFLLAQQIGEADLSALDTALAAIPVDDDATGTGLPIEDTQDTAAAVANMPSDPAGVIAAILQQLPAPEDRGQKIAPQQTTQPLALNSLQKAEDPQAIRPLTLNAPNSLHKTDDLEAIHGYSPETDQKKSAVILMDDQVMQNTAIDRLSLEAVRRADMSSGTIQSIQNPVQTVASPSGYAAMPGTLANNTPPGIAPTIATPLGQHGWANEFAQKINWVSTQQNHVAELHLNPPNLGPLDVVLKISDNQATALFTSPHGAVRDAVENALPKLREILADNGIMLGNATISDQAPRDRSTGEFMNQGFGAAAQHDTSMSADDGSAGAQTITTRRHNGMVDTFA